MSDKESSSLKGYVDSATGSLQSAFGSLTGSTADQVSGIILHSLEDYDQNFGAIAAWPPRLSQEDC